MNIFEQALRMRLRFESKKGMLQVEDLWSLTLKQLDEIAIELNKAKKDVAEESFITTRTNESTELNLKFDIVLYIIKAKSEEKDNRKIAIENKAKANRIKSLIAEKEDEEIKGKTKEELQKLLDELKV